MYSIVCIQRPATALLFATGLRDQIALGINYIGTKGKCRHLKKLTCKGTLPQVFIRVYRLVTQCHVGIFDQALRTVAPLTFSLVIVLSPLPLPCVNKYTLSSIHVYSV
jgi:hypothetical protein